MRFAAGVLVAVGVAGVGAEARPPAAWATVIGRVVLPPDAPVPGPKLLPGVAVPDEKVLVNPKNRGIKNVLVWLRPDSTDPKAKFGTHEIHPLDAKRQPRQVAIAFAPRQVFEPRVVGARVGDWLVVRNLSPVATNFLWASANNGNVNALLVPNQAFQFPAPLAAEPWPIAFQSNVVPTGGYVRIFDHPYFAVTDADGAFELRDAPVGKYRLVCWHENKGFNGGRAGRFGQPVAIAPDKDGAMVLPPVAFDVR